MKKIKILDCSIRDGGHLNLWDFAEDFARKAFYAAAKSGVDIIELGYISDESIGQERGHWGYIPFETISKISSDLKKERLNVSLAIMVDVGKFNANQFPEKVNTSLDLIRVAFYKPQLDAAIKDLETLLGKGYEVALNLMGIANYSPTERDLALRELSRIPLSSVYVADSFGSLMPEEVSRLVKEFKEKTGKEVGFHAHNNIQMAFQNALSAIDAGASYIDVTLNGIGRGAGNLPSELFLQYLNKISPSESYDLAPIFDFINEEMQKLRSNLQWGYTPGMALSGIFACHPKYVIALKEKGFSESEMSPILQKIEIKKTSGFDEKLLEKILLERENGP